MDARPERAMVWLTENIQACLRIFWQLQHQWLARDILHQPQGVYSVFVLHPVSTSKSVLSVLSVVEQKSRGREPLSPGEGYRCGSRGAYFVLPTAAILFSGGLEGPARQDWELRHRAAAKTRLEQRPMTEGPRRNAS